MVAIIRMGMVVHPAKPEIQQVSRYDQGNGRNQQPGLVMDKKLFYDQENKPCSKKRNGKPAVMMLFITMIKRIGANQERQNDHSGFEKDIMNDIDAKQGEAGEKQRQEGTVNGAGHRSGNTQGIPVDPEFHHDSQSYKKATLLQKIFGADA